MTRSNGPYDQAPNWRYQSRAGHDQAGDDHQQQQWQPGQDDHDQSQQFAVPSLPPEQDYAAYQPAPDPAHAYRTGHPQQAGQDPAFDPYQPGNGQPLYPAEPQPGALHVPPPAYDVPPPQSSLGERLREAEPPLFDDPYARADLRPAVHDHDVHGLNPNQTAPQLSPLGGQPEPDVSAYDLGNYTPSGAPTADRPAFGEPGYAPPNAGDWEFSPQAYGEAQPGQGPSFDLDGQEGAVTQHGDVYAEDGDDEYDYEYEDEGRGSSRKLVIAGALVSAIVVGGGFAFGYNALFSGKPSESGPPIVKAEAGPAKVQPAEPGGRKFEHTGSKLMGKLGGTAVADRAASANTDEPSANRVRSVSTLVVGRDGRLIVPDASQSSGGDTQTAAARPAAPRTTSPVPGMTIVGGTPPAQPAGLGASNVNPAPTPPPATAIAAAPTPPPVVPAAQPPAARKPRPSNLPPLPERSGLARPKVAAVTPSAAAPAPAAQQANVTPVVPRAQPRSSPPAAAAPARTTTPTRTAAPAGSASNGYVAVLSTKRSRIDALTSFADLQQKYGSILSTKVPDVRRADLSSRGLGVMYRAVVGPPASRQAASQLCSRLKTAGYSGCWVTAY